MVQLLLSCFPACAAALTAAPSGEQHLGAGQERLSLNSVAQWEIKKDINKSQRPAAREFDCIGRAGIVRYAVRSEVMSQRAARLLHPVAAGGNTLQFSADRLRTHVLLEPIMAQKTVAPANCCKAVQHIPMRLCL